MPSYSADSKPHMASKSGQNSAILRELRARTQRLEKEQRDFEARMAANEAQINQLTDKQSDLDRRFRASIKELVDLFRKLTAQTIASHELHAKAELRLDRQQELLASQQMQMAELRADIKDLVKSQKETDRKLKELLDLERRRLSNGRNGKQNGKRN